MSAGRVLPALFTLGHALSAQRARTMIILGETLQTVHLCRGDQRAPPPPGCLLLCLELLWVWGWRGSGPCCTPTPFPMALLQPLPYLSAWSQGPRSLSPHPAPPSPVGEGGNHSFSPASMPLSGLVTPPGQGGPLLI